jgi:hypothetical protein
MKKIALIAAMGLMGIGSAMAQTQTVPGNFNVTVSLASKCRMSTSAPVLGFGTYTAFTTTDVPANAVDITFECTRNFAAVPTVSFDGATATATSGATSATVSGTGVVDGLYYTMSATQQGATLPGTAPVAGSTVDLGTPTSYTYRVTGNMPAGQAGTRGGSGTQARQLIVTF